MQIAYHIGANCTDDDRLLKSLLKNANTLLKERVAVPGPGRYRSLIRETIQGLGGRRPQPETRDVLIDAIVENDDVQRIVLSNSNFICVPNRIFENDVFYVQAGAKTRALRQLFQPDDLSLYMGIRNPATFLQDTFRKSNAATVSEYLGLIPPNAIRWSDVIQRITDAVPDVPLTVWCNEDTPLLWDQLIRDIADVDAHVAITGGFDILSGIISSDGMSALRAQLLENPPETDAGRHELIAEIWEQYALDEKIEDEINLPELDPALVEQMTESYEHDLARIAAIPGVSLILPFT